MEFSILGPLEVRADDRTVLLGGVKPRALLAMLVLHANEPVSAERLALGLWGEDAPAGATKTVQVHVSRLRKALGDSDVLVTTPAGYRLRVRPGELDAERFDALVDAGRRALARATPSGPGPSCARRSGCGAGRRSPTSPTEPFASALVAVIVAAVLAFEGARDEPDAVRVPLNSVAVIDARSNQVRSAIEVDEAPGPITAGAGVAVGAQP